MCGRFLEEDTDTDTAENVTRFLRNANPENLPLIGETEESMFPILNKRVTDFLTLETDVFQWGGWYTLAGTD